MAALTKILTDIVDGVNWPVIFYILFALFVLWILVRWLHLSPVHIAIEILREITGLFDQHGFNRAAIDGVTTIAFIVFTLVTLLVTEVRELPEILSIFRVGVEGAEQPLFLTVFMAFLTGLIAILSLLVTGIWRH